ncbi:MAG: RNA 3'-terminal phosphate cyclase [Thermodesulfobacteriota bacterium]
MSRTVTIDGSQGEGGGQILRSALALSALLGQAVEVINIRANRPKPGLRPQHLVAAQALAAITQGDLDGAEFGSVRLRFSPRAIQGGNYRFAMTTAGATTLLAAAILPALLFAKEPSTVVIQGGTHVPWSPPFPYLAEVFLPALARLGASVRAELRRSGWYPQGGGEVVLRITPCKQLTGHCWRERGRLTKLDLAITLVNLPAHIASREEREVGLCLNTIAPHPQARVLQPSSRGAGNLVFLRADYADSVAGFSCLGRQGLPAEEVARTTAEAFLSFERSGATVDCHLADQLALYLALAQGQSSLVAEETSSHLRTNLAIIEQLLPARFALDPETGLLTTSGIGYTRSE